LTKNESAIINYDLPAKIIEIQSDIEAIEKDRSLYEEKSFDNRMEVIDFIEFQVIDQIDGLLRKSAQRVQLDLLKCRAVKVKSDLEEINISLFKRLREDIRRERI